MAAAAGPRSLSDLPDDVLLRVLFFTPAREAASTSVLSRRWRSLWRASGAVNLDSRSAFSRGSSSHHEPEERQEVGPMSFLERERRSIQEREDFLRAAEEAFAAAAVPVTRLTLFFAKDSRINLTHIDDWRKHDLVGAVVSNPAARRVEELHIEVEGWEEYALSFGSLPSAALRLLRVTNCSPLTAAPPPGGNFPRLSELHLQTCTVPLDDLRRIADATPQLAPLHIDASHISTDRENHYNEVVQHCRIIFPAVTALVFSGRSRQRQWDKFRLELDVPRLQYFRYEGDLQLNDWLSLKPQASPNSVQVDFDLRIDYNARGDVRESFWQLIKNFNAAKVLKLKLDCSMDEVAVVDKGSQDELLGSLLFSNLERLELEGRYEPTSNTSMVMLSNFLHCCPMVQKLRLKLTKTRTMTRYSIDKEAQTDFDKSVNCFRNRRTPKISLGGEDDYTSKVPYIHGLSDESFNCMRSYLRRVSLHFCMEGPNSLGVQLAKFFAENAEVLEELYIDDGRQKMSEHTNFSVRRSIANSAKTRNITAVAVLPH